MSVQSEKLHIKEKQWPVKPWDQISNKWETTQHQALLCYTGCFSIYGNQPLIIRATQIFSSINHEHLQPPRDIQRDSSALDLSGNSTVWLWNVFALRKSQTYWSQEVSHISLSSFGHGYPPEKNCCLHGLQNLEVRTQKTGVWSAGCRELLTWT